MQFEEEKAGEVLVVNVLVPRLDPQLSSELKAILNDAIARGERLILVDLSGVDFIDSACLVALFGAAKMLSEDGGFALCGVQEAVADLLHMVKADRVLLVFLDRQEAIEVISQGDSPDTDRDRDKEEG